MMKSKPWLTLTLLLLAATLTAAAPEAPACDWGRPDYPACAGRLTETRMVNPPGRTPLCWCDYSCRDNVYDYMPATTCSKSGKLLRIGSYVVIGCRCKGQAWCHKLVN